jgi:hypothetical protein
MRARIKRRKPGVWSWSVRLGGRLPRGRYTVRVRALDSLGNVSKSFAGSARLRVGR